MAIGLTVPRRRLWNLRRIRPRSLASSRRRTDWSGRLVVDSCKARVQPWLPEIVLVWLAGVLVARGPPAVELVHGASAEKRQAFRPLPARCRACWSGRPRG